MREIILEHHAFEEGDLKQVTTAYLDQYPIVYILYNRHKNRPDAYIGQTVQVDKRMKQHLKDSRRKNLTDALLIGHERFNQSATYNIETNLINHFIGDEQFRLQNVSQTRQIQSHSYYEKAYYDEKVFQELWEKLQKAGLAQNSSDVIRNKDIYKISPYRELSSAQLEIKNKILAYCKRQINGAKKQVFLIEGDAGTGKSVVLASLFNTLQDLAKDLSSPLNKTENYLLVNHGEMLKTYHSMAASLPNLKKSHILRPTTFINRMAKNNQQADIVLVDEAHLLLTKKDAYNSFYQENQLNEILKHSKIVILIFDPKQVLKTKSYWHQSLLENIPADCEAEYFKLENQFRMQSSPAMLEWIDRFVAKEILPLPPEEAGFEFEIMESGHALKERISELNAEKGLSRLVSTFDYRHKKDGGQYLVDDSKSGVRLPWNTTDSKVTWAERPTTINEVGSIYTVQGFDLNYVGVVLGPSVDYDPQRDCLTIDPHKYQDVGAFLRREDLNPNQLAQVKEEIILNSINVLMKRGINGLLLYPVNENLRNHLLQLKRERDRKQ